MMNWFVAMCFAVTILSTIVATIIMVATLIYANGAPQDAAGFALALAVWVIPYIFSRCVEITSRPEVQRVEVVEKSAAKATVA